MGARAIIAGSGALPGLVLQAGPAHIVRFQGVEPSGTADAPQIDARVDALGDLFQALRAAQVSELCLAGAMSRPEALERPDDPVSAAALSRILAAQGHGDDHLLREIIAIFEEQGFALRGASELRPDLVVSEGTLAGQADPTGDATRARDVLTALGGLDVGQAAVAAKGQMLGIETLQGTDAMLRFVRETAPNSGGVLVKRAKPGQDLRVDMPAIGPDTVRGAADAGLSGIELQAGAVLLLDRAAVLQACAATGLNLWAAP